MAELSGDPASGVHHLLAPVDRQEIWAAGITYERSRAARQEEAQDGGDIYARVYTAAEMNVVGPRGLVGFRSDAAWSVPEPELAVVMNPRLDVVGFSVLSIGPGCLSKPAAG